MKMRILDIHEDNAFMQMAIDEAMLICRSEGKIADTLRFFTWDPPAVSIGYFQSLEKEVDLIKAEEAGVDVVRRYTGGGAVFHDKELTYSIVLDEKNVSSDIVESYGQICKGIVDGLKIIGVDAAFKPVNDIIANGRKISGSAQTRKQGVVLQHGTILMDVDVDRMFSLLKVPDEKIRDKMIQVVKERVTSVNKELGKEVRMDELKDALVKGFCEALGVECEKGELTAEEKELAEKLYKEKYSTREWNFMR